MAINKLEERPSSPPAATADEATPPKPCHLRFQGRPKGIALVVILGALFMNFNFAILSTVVPDIARELDSNEASVLWVTLGPFLVNASMMPAAGKLADAFGRKNVWLFGFTLNFIAMLGAGFAGSLPVLLFFRVIQGFGASLDIPSGMAMLLSSVSAEQRTMYIGFMMAIGTVGPTMGMALGGALVESFGWRMLFLGPLPGVALALFIALFVLQNQSLSPGTWKVKLGDFDFLGTGLFALVAGSLLFAVNQGQAMGWSNPIIIAFFSLSGTLMPVFWFVERKAKQPIIPPVFFTVELVLVFLAFGLSACCYMAAFSALPFYLRDFKGETATAAGLLLLARPLTAGAIGPIFGRAAKHITLNKQMGSALFPALLSYVLFAILLPRDPPSIFVILDVGLFLQGLSGGVASVVWTAFTLSRVADEFMANTNGIIMMAITALGSIGMAMGLAVVEVSGGTSKKASYTTLFTILSILVGLCWLCTLGLAFTSYRRQKAVAAKTEFQSVSDQSAQEMARMETGTTAVPPEERDTVSLIQE